jgi:ATP-dependent DNA helicase PIF1
MTNAQSNADEHKGGNKGPIIVAAPTGAAALVINGQTIHRAFYISNSDAANPNNAQLSHKLQRDLDGVEVIILDEMSMIAPKQLKNINDRLNMAFPDPARVRPQGLEVDVNKNSTQLFGGRHIIIAGDFCQLPPVKCPHGLYSSENIDQNLGSGRELFLKFNTVVELSKQLRQQGDTSFSSILNRVRVGNVENNDLEVLNSRIGSESEIKARLQQTAKSGQSVLWCAATHNKVNRLNSQNLNLLANLKQRAIVNIYAQHLMSSSNPLMKVSGAFSDSYNYAEEMPEEEEQLQVDEDLDFSTTQKKQKRNNVSYRYFCHDKDTLTHLFNLKPGSQDDRLAPVLQLVKGARVMLIKNLAVELGLVNGAIGTVIGFLYQENEESQPVAPLIAELPGIYLCFN